MGDDELRAAFRSLYLAAASFAAESPRRPLPAARSRTLVLTVAVALACVAVGQAGDLVALAHGVTPSGPLGMPPAP